MRAYDQGSLVRVTCSAEDVAKFKRGWPGSGMRSSDRVSFTFDKRNGDLVDYVYNAKFPAPERVDDGALAALGYDAQIYSNVALTLRKVGR